MNAVANESILQIENLRVEAASAGGRVVPVRDVSFEIRGGERFGIIGESGSGKTTTIRAIVGLLERNVEIASGRISFRGRPVWEAGAERFASIRGRDVGMVFQSPRGSLNPLRTIGSQLGEVLRVHRPELSPVERQARIEDVLSRMRFADVDTVLKAYPHELSGGMCQRAAIGLAIAVEPSLLLADECTSALDVTTQAEVIELIRELCAHDRRALIFVTHDLLLAAEICTTIAVMYAGEIVELGTVDEVLGSPRHPYTQGLIRAVPAWEPKVKLVGIAGAPPRVTPEFSGCGFRERCSLAVDACSNPIPLYDLGTGRSVRCVLHAPAG